MTKAIIQSTNTIGLEMNLESWDARSQLEQLRQRSNEMWDQLLARLPASDTVDQPISFMPEVDLIESAQEYRIYLSIPGLIEDDIMIEVQGRILTIRGERRPPYDSDRRETRLNEWRYGFFERHFELSSAISVTHLRATCDAGVLTVVAKKLSSEPTTDENSSSGDQESQA